MPELSATTWIVTAVSLGLVILLVVAYTVQTIEKNNRERRRLETALKLRSHEFNELLDALPASMLGRNLRLLICQGLEDVSQQLHKLNPREITSHDLEHLQALRARMAQEPEQIAYQTLTDGVQIKETQRQLKQLHAYLLRLRSAGRLTQAQAQQYVRQLQHLLVLTSLDGYQLASQQALQADKPRLAIHYLQLALERMQKHNTAEVFNARIQQTQNRITALEQSNPDTDASGSPAQKSSTPPAASTEAWDQFEESGDEWKKKSLYD